jgi:thymidylate synthase
VELILDNLQNDYVDLVQTVANDGQPVVVREQMTYELTNVTLVFPRVEEPMLPVKTGRKINTKLAAVETLDIIAGTSHGELVLRAAPEYGAVLVDSSDLDYGAYGPRLSAQLQQCVTALRIDPTSRQAIATIWRPDDLTHNGDRPCTVMLHFLIRDGKLELHTTMRSNDVWLGTPYDVFAFTQLQQTVAYALDVSAGQYVHHATSLHLYHRNFAQVDELDHVDSVAYALTRDTLPRGVRPLAAVQTPVERHNFTLLQNTAFMLLETSSRLRSHDLMPHGADAAWQNPWYAGQLEKLIDVKEVQA